MLGPLEAPNKLETKNKLDEFSDGQLSNILNDIFIHHDKSLPLNGGGDKSNYLFVGLSIRLFDEGVDVIKLSDGSKGGRYEVKRYKDAMTTSKEVTFSDSLDE